MKFIKKNAIFDGFNIISFCIIASILLLTSCNETKDIYNEKKYYELNSNFGDCVHRSDTNFYPIHWKWVVIGKNDNTQKYLIYTYENIGVGDLDKEWIEARYLFRCK